MKSNNGIAIRVKGKVQGVGFRPFVWQLAKKYHLLGYVYNDTSGVLIYLLLNDNLPLFLHDLSNESPILARIDSITSQDYQWQIEPTTFTILASQQNDIDTFIVPDAATCDDCLAELEQIDNRRFNYPFINCTHCGPRFTIIENLPYDRANTTMRDFELCKTCQQEYNNPADRRFHAQPTACSVCGPKIWYVDLTGVELAQANEALDLALTHLKQGCIIAIKNLGGFHLVCDAQQVNTINLLRKRKNRPHQPFAVMLPNIDWLDVCTNIGDNYCEVVKMLTSTIAPIILLPINKNSPIAREVSPDLTEIGIMLPANPLQHLLAKKYQRPLVMTSANANSQPPVIDNKSALNDLQGLADYWLLHNRTIEQRADDSVVRLHMDGVEIIRRSRGYVPDSIRLPDDLTSESIILTLGADLKNTFCIVNKQNVMMSQHMGNLISEQSIRQWQETINKWLVLYNPTLNYIVADAHPSYISHQYGRQLSHHLDIPFISVLHHHAHLAACLAEYNYPLLGNKVIGLVLDGLGYGQNGELWGGECLLFDYSQCVKLGGLPATALPGGNLAARQPWRNLIAHCINFAPEKVPLLSDMLPNINVNDMALMIQSIKQQINAPLASSTGRLFDAVASSLGIAPYAISWEGEAACKLEAIANKYHGSAISSITIPITVNMTLDLAYFWNRWFNCDVDLAAKAYSFHHALAAAFAELAKIACKKNHTDIIVISGGVLQNKLLRRLLLLNLSTYTVYIPHNLPCNDGAISFGQAIVAKANLKLNSI